MSKRSLQATSTKPKRKASGRPELARQLLGEPLMARLASGLARCHVSQGLLAAFALAAVWALAGAPGFAGEWLLSPTAWVSAFVALLLTAWLELPAASRRATRLSRGLEVRADSMLASHPERGLGLYRKAHRISFDARHKARLCRKMKYLEEQISEPSKLSEPSISKSSESPKAASPEPRSTPIAPGDVTLIDPVRPTEVQVKAPATGAPTAQAESPQADSSDASDGFDCVGHDGRYALCGEIARGGSAIVFRATDRVLGRELALKQLPRGGRNKPLAERFRQEARALASLSHPNIVQIYDLFEDGEELWIAMELATGGNLAQAIKLRAPFSLAEAIDLVVPIAYALGAAHSADIVHRDVKPLNILLTADATPKLVDFGLAKLTASSVETIEGSVMGSPTYMSPQQAAGGKVGPASDMYSLGVTFYELVTGRPPFEGGTAEIMAQHITQAPLAPAHWRPDLPPQIEDLILAMLEKDTARRPKNMAEFAERAAASSTDHTSPRPG